MMIVVATVPFPVRVVVPQRVPLSQSEAIGSLIGYAIAFLLIGGWYLWNRWRD